MKPIAAIALSTIPMLAAAVIATAVAGTSDLTTAQAESAHSGSSNMSDAEIRQTLQAAGYTNVQLGGHERGRIEARATKDGQPVELEVDTQSGAVSQHVQTEKDDDDDD